MTFAVWLTALFAVFTFSSCLDSNDDGQRQGSEIVKVAGMMGTYEFESAGGYKLVPTNMSSITMNIDTKYAFIAYSFNSNDAKEKTRIPVSLTGVMPIPERYAHNSLDGMKEFANAPIRNITSGGSYEFFPISFWDANTMFLPITYFIRDLGDQKELTAEVASHSFEVYYDLEDKAGDDQTLVLRVAHRVSDDSLNKDRSRRYNTNIYHIDLSYVLAQFKDKNKRMPGYICVKYQGNNYSGSFVENEIREETVKVDYEALLKIFDEQKK